jgi:hypothetical protein
MSGHDATLDRGQRDDVAFDEVGLKSSGGAEAPTPVQNETGRRVVSRAAAQGERQEAPDSYVEAGAAAPY